MQKNSKLEVLPPLPPDMEDLKVKILDYDRGFTSSYEKQMGYAFLCGVALNTLKSMVKHGEFTALREAHLPELTHSRAARFMQFAEGLQAKFPTVGNLKPQLLLTNGELPEKEKGAVLKAVYEAADGKTLTQFYRDLGVIRQPKKGDEKKAAVKMTPEEALWARTKQVNDLARQAADIWQTLCSGQDSEGFALITKETRDICLAANIEANERLRKLGSKTKARGKAGAKLVSGMACDKCKKANSATRCMHCAGYFCGKHHADHNCKGAK